MAELIKRKQLNWVQSAPILVKGFTATAANNTTITTAITNALNTAGRGNTSVPLQVSSDEEKMGIISQGDYARVEIWDGTSGDKISGDADGNEVYGRVTESSGAYTLSYFYKDDTGTEQPHTFATATDIDFNFNYRYSAASLPADAHIGLLALQISQDVGGRRTAMKRERLTVTAQNTLSNLSNTVADATQLQLVVNGVDYWSGTGEPVTLTGQTPGWNPSAFGADKAWNIETDDTVFAIYPYNL